MAATTTYDSLLVQDGDRYEVVDGEGGVLWAGEALPPGEYTVHPGLAPDLHQELYEALIPPDHPSVWPEFAELTRLCWDWPDFDDYAVDPIRPYNWRTEDR